jgi:hypothetical protein
LAIVVIKGHIDMTWLPGVKASQMGQCTILGTIVNPHTFPVPSIGLKRHTDLCSQAQDIFPFVLDWDNDAEQRSWPL